MIHAHKDIQERGLDLGQVLQCQRAFVELPFFEPFLDQFADRRFHALRRGVFNGAHRRFDRVGEHHDACLFRLRLRAGVAVVLLLDLIDLGLVLGVLGKLQCFLIEVVDPGGPVMHRDEIHHLLRQVVFPGKRHAVLDVRGNDERTHAGGELVVLAARALLVLDEVGRFFDLPDVMEIRSDTREDLVRPDRRCRGFGEAGHGHAVMIGARRLHSQHPQERMVEMRQLQKRQVGGHLEDSFQEDQQAVGQHRRHDGVHEREAQLLKDDGHGLETLEAERDNGKAKPRKMNPSERKICVRFFMSRTEYTERAPPTSDTSAIE